MPDHISSSMYTNDVSSLDTRRLKSFIKGIVIARKKFEEKETAREELKKQIGKVQKLVAGKKVSVDAMRQHVAEIENKVNNVLQKEAKLLRSSEYENKTITQLKKRVNELEQEVSVKDIEKSNVVRTLNDTISALQNKIDSYIDSRTEREKRIEELEEKIKEKADVINKVAKLEQKYEELKQREDVDERDLDMIKYRIDQLKTNI